LREFLFVVVEVSWKKEIVTVLLL